MVMIGNIEFKNLGNGNRLVIHPSGVRVTETSEMVNNRVQEIQNQITELQTQLDAENQLTEQINNQPIETE